MLRSAIECNGDVPFPAFRGERIYMQAFSRSDGLPEHLRHWQPTVDRMLIGISDAGPIYMMVDQAEIPAGAHHRRPGVHIDGQWIPELGCHGHVILPRGIEYILLASDVPACRGFVGHFVGSPASDGDCGHIDLSGADEVHMQSGLVYRGESCSLVHESLPLPVASRRTLVRLNVRC